MLVCRGETSTQVSLCYRLRLGIRCAFPAGILLRSEMKVQPDLRLLSVEPEKTADIWRHYHWFPRQMISEKRVQKFHSASDWSCHLENLIQPIRSATQI